jgi:hypothetical protein
MSKRYLFDDPKLSGGRIFPSSMARCARCASDDPWADAAGGRTAAQDLSRPSRVLTITPADAG